MVLPIIDGLNVPLRGHAVRELAEASIISVCISFSPGRTGLRGQLLNNRLRCNNSNHNRSSSRNNPDRLEQQSP